MSVIYLDMGLVMGKLMLLSPGLPALHTSCIGGLCAQQCKPRRQNAPHIRQHVGRVRHVQQCVRACLRMCQNICAFSSWKLKVWRLLLPVVHHVHNLLAQPVCMCMCTPSL